MPPPHNAGCPMFDARSIASTMGYQHSWQTESR